MDWTGTTVEFVLSDMQGILMAEGINPSGVRDAEGVDRKREGRNTKSPEKAARRRAALMLSRKCKIVETSGRTCSGKQATTEELTTVKSVPRTML